MKNFLIKRHGSNSANQPVCQVAVLGIVEAESFAEARQLATQQFGCYNNQHLEILGEDEASTEGWNEAVELSAARTWPNT